MTEPWPTAITEIQPNAVRVRGYDIADLMGRVSFGQAVYLIIRGELPTDEVGKLMDAIIVSSIDHGATPPSVLSARTVASTGASLSQSVAAGILSINQHHGGAITNCALHLGNIIQDAGEHPSDEDLRSSVLRYLTELKASGKRMAGFGHRIHSADPRTARLYELAVEAGVDGLYIRAAHAVQQVFLDQGKALPINVDGAIGSILGQLGFNPDMMNGMFMIARVPGLVAHVTEEQSRMKPMRKIDPVNHIYDGPPARPL